MLFFLNKIFSPSPLLTMGLDLFTS